MTEEELQEAILRVFQFFAVGKPGKTEVGLKEIVEGFAITITITITITSQGRLRWG